MARLTSNFCQMRGQFFPRKTRYIFESQGMTSQAIWIKLFFHRHDGFISVWVARVLPNRKSFCMTRSTRLAPDKEFSFVNQPSLRILINLFHSQDVLIVR